MSLKYNVILNTVPEAGSHWVYTGLRGDKNSTF